MSGRTVRFIGDVHGDPKAYRDATPDRPVGEGEGWSWPELGFRDLRVHPEHLVSEEDLALVHLFGLNRSGGMAPGPLPFAGGWADQPADIIAAFGEIAAAGAIVEKVRG